ncbi:carboxymuconolactone decarboxylase family protein [Streptomyces sp. W16]|uniref:carboxymuconolactone decarboxylase family protein n=1 Tax=Streptomyces sp. W16 TaxID=3076631 RepID=UPI00295B363E|nr:carboxymuconolactone decarboxylase family protein [Streptomyces sp. W16]MDV9168948.1 carboxymuconolactone decarboxylase family protein [Streptomyces sp. W16]
MRLAPLQELNADQSEFRDRLIAQRGGIHGPFEVLLRSPHLGDRMEALSTYCMRDSALPPNLRELTLLVAARRFDAQHSWNAHLGKAVAAGLDPSALDRLARGEDPRFDRADEAILHRFAVQALTVHFVDDETYAAALAEFGEAALVDLVVALGTFATLALVLNTFQVDLQPDREPPFPDVHAFQHIRPDQEKP